MKGIKTVDINVQFIEEVLGSASSDKDVYSKFIASKREAGIDADEINAISEEVSEKGLTVFPRTEDGHPMFWDYQIKGYFKDTCGALSRVKSKDGKSPRYESGKIKAYKKIIDGLVFVSPRKIQIDMPEGAEIGRCERPLRAQTLQGERVALAASETIPADSTIKFSVDLLDEDLLDTLIEWMEYGYLRGMGQWRNSGKGRFLYTMTDHETGEVISSNEE